MYVYVLSCMEVACGRGALSVAELRYVLVVNGSSAHAPFSVATWQACNRSLAK